jgi:outer membrane lipoprotein SlyB
MRLSIFFPFVSVAAFMLAGCAPNNYSPNTYSSNAVQLANKVEAGAIIGFREVQISANGSIGAVTGGAVGGVLGAEYANSALIAVAGTAVGGMVGNALEHAARDTTGWEYIIRKDNNDMLSVTQRERAPLGLGQRVLVIMGPQARVVPDYSVPQEPKVAATPPPVEEKKEAKTEPVKVEVVLSLPPGVTVQPKAEETKTVVAEEPPQALRPAPFEERLLEAMTLNAPLSEILMNETPTEAAGVTTEAETPADAAPESVAQDSSEPAAPPSK